MTVSNNEWRTSYNGNGSTTAFSSTFKILDQDHVRVTLVDSDGDETVQTITTHYSVTGVGNTTFTVTMVTAPASGSTLVLTRAMPFTQEYDYQETGVFPAEQHEAALDLRTMEAQEVNGRLDLALKLSDADTSGVSTTFPAFEAAKFVRVNTLGTAIELANAVYDNGTYLLSGIGTEERTVDSKLSDWVSAFDFGVTANGSTDDTLAIHSAINHCANYGKDLVMPRGRYAVDHFCVGYDATLNPDYPATAQPFRIIFEGRSSDSELQFADTLSQANEISGAVLVQRSAGPLSVPLVYFRPTSSGNFNNRGIEIIGLKAIANTHHYVVDGTYTWEWVIRGLFVKNCYAYGNGVSINNFEKCIFEDWTVASDRDTTTYPVASRGGTVGIKLSYRNIDGSSCQLRRMVATHFTTGYVEGDQSWRRSFTFATGSPGTITDNTAGDKMGNALVAGDAITITGSASNNATYTVASVNSTGSIITLVSGPNANEAAVTCNMEQNDQGYFHNHDVKTSVMTTGCHYGAVLGGAQTGQTYIGCQFRGEKTGLALTGKQHNAVFHNLDIAQTGPLSQTPTTGSVGLHFGSVTSSLTDIHGITIDGLFAQNMAHHVKIENYTTIRNIHINNMEANVNGTGGVYVFWLNGGAPNEMTLSNVRWNGVGSLFSSFAYSEGIKRLENVGDYTATATYRSHELNGAKIGNDSSLSETFVGGNISSEGVKTVSAFSSANTIDLDSIGSAFDSNFDNVFICSVSGGTLKYLTSAIGQTGLTIRVLFSNATPPALEDTNASAGIRVPSSPRTVAQYEVIEFTLVNARWYITA